MAQSYVSSAGSLLIPGGYASWTAKTDNSGLATSGVIALIGEAESGPDFSAEDKLNDNFFGPDEGGAVLAKYGSGNLVDAYRAASVAVNDPAITGSPSGFILVKTNVGAKAQSTYSTQFLLDDAAGTTPYAILRAKLEGAKGNNIYWNVTETAEVAPTTGTFTYIPAVDTANTLWRVNGSVVEILNFGANRTPTQFVADINGLAAAGAQVVAAGGVNRVSLPVAGAGITLALSHVLNVVTITLAGAAFAATPVIGDTLIIPTGSAIVGAANANRGAYVVTNVSGTVVTATKLSDAGGGVAGTITEPADVVATPLVAVTDYSCWTPVTIGLDTTKVVGVGKSLEIIQLSTGNDRFERMCYEFGTATKVLSSSGSKWISSSLIGGAADLYNTVNPYILTSSVERQATVNVNRQSDSVQEELTAGGDIGLRIGYVGTSASVVINDTTMTMTLAGGVSAGLSPIAVTLSSYTTIADLAAYINSIPGFTCSPGTAVVGQLPPTVLDNGTYTFASTGTALMPGRIKLDGYRIFNKVNESVLVEMVDSLGDSVQPVAGLPKNQAGYLYLSSGSKGSTLAVSVTNALTALESCRCNFVVPLFSRDASLDIADGLTESASTYDIDAVNLACRTHVLKMSQLKRRRNRQALLSISDTFANSKTAAANIASFRCAMPFQDAKNLSSAGVVTQYQPWMAAAMTAGGQAAAFYKALVHKYANASSFLSAAGDFDDQHDSSMEQALQAGLRPFRQSETGGWRWVSDQTTYGTDSNFVYNSIQAVYCADIVALTTAQRMENAFVGQSVADVSASLALAVLEAIMADFMRLKLLAASDDAPRGFKNASIRLSGTALVVSAEIKLAGAIYFVPISFLVSQVEQSA